jgi:hypothetical protein
MTQEEKAKAYDELFIKAKQIYNNENDVLIMHTIEDLFPELKESEDEKVMKKLINLVKKSYEQGGYALHKWEADEMLAWLEKQVEHANFRNKIQVGDKVTRNEDGVLVNLSQLNRVAKKNEKQGKQKASYTTIVETGDGGINALVTRELPTDGCDDEQKPADTVEPKFHEGDWVVYKNDICQIVKREEGCNKLVTVFGIEKELVNERNLSTARLWTIQDAKDGDVLVTRKKQPFIFKNYDENTDYIYAYCGICDLVKDNSFYADNDQLWTCYSVAGDVYPTTKEQCDTLLKAMKAAGYEFDFEKKELKIVDWSKHIKCNPNPPSIITKKSAWSEKDENYINDLIKYFSQNERLKNTKEDIVIWLKSLRPQNRWKLSEEQMEALDSATENCAYSEYQDCLRELIEQLKKLKEGV